MHRILAAHAYILNVSHHAFGQGRGGGVVRPSGGSHGYGGDHIPAHGPGPARMAPQQGGGVEHSHGGDVEHHGPDMAGHPAAPPLHHDDHWIGHDSGRHDPYYHLHHPFLHGHFYGGV